MWTDTIFLSGSAVMQRHAVGAERSCETREQSSIWQRETPVGEEAEMGTRGASVGQTREGPSAPRAGGAARSIVVSVASVGAASCQAVGLPTPAQQMLAGRHLCLQNRLQESCQALHGASHRGGPSTSCSPTGFLAGGIHAASSMGLSVGHWLTQRSWSSRPESILRKWEPLIWCLP